MTNQEPKTNPTSNLTESDKFVVTSLAVSNRESRYLTLGLSSRTFSGEVDRATLKFTGLLVSFPEALIFENPKM